MTSCIFDLGSELRTPLKVSGNKSTFINNTSSQQLTCAVELQGLDAGGLSAYDLLLSEMVNLIKIDTIVDDRPGITYPLRFNVYMDKVGLTFEIFGKLKVTTYITKTVYYPIIVIGKAINPADSLIYNENSFTCRRNIGNDEYIDYKFQGDGGWNFTYSIILPPINTSKNLKGNQLTQVNDSPSIFIKSQLLIDYSDIGNTDFKVILKQTEIIYEKSCPKIVSVLKGKGNDAWSKLNDIYVEYNVNIEGFSFVKNMMEYSMVRYLFTKLLYGKFMIRYLLQNYYIKFLEDLKNSQYSNFYSYFTQGEFENYYKYFRHDC